MVTVSGGRIDSPRVAMWRVPRTRGAASGILLVLLGAWGGLVPFIGPHFGYAYTPNATWTMTAGRLWLEVVPGAVAVIGGLILLSSTSRVLGLWAGWLTAVAGAWFAVGPVVSPLLGSGAPQPGSPVGGSTLSSVVEEIGFFTGLGVVIVFLAATALGRFSVIGVQEHRAATEPAQPMMMESQPTTELPRHAADESDES
jgi:MFS family permease